MRPNAHHPSFTDALPMSNVKQISEDHFKRTFGIQPNALHATDDLYDFHSALLDHHDQQQKKHIQHVLQSDPRCVWTLMDIENNDVLVSGYHPAKRVGYCRLGHIISQKPINEGVEMVVPLSKRLT